MELVSRSNARAVRSGNPAAGDHVISHDEAVTPVTVPVPPYQRVIEDGSKDIDVLEEGTAVLLVETAVFGPGKKLVPVDEMIAHGAEIGPRMVRVRGGMVGIVDEVLVGVVDVLGRFGAQEQVGGGDLAEPDRRSAIRSEPNAGARTSNMDVAPRSRRKRMCPSLLFTACN